MSAESVWRHLTANGMTQAGAAGMMGNIKAESGMIANRVEILCLKRLQELGKYYSDATYTAFVDDGTITREQFLHPLPGKQYGYGLCQWTSPGRKGKLYDYAKSRKVSIGDEAMQLDFLIGELKDFYPDVWKTLSTTSDIITASNIVLMQFEQPADTGETVRRTRQKYAQEYYDMFAEGKMTEKEAIDRVLSIALAEDGYKEKRSEKDLDSKTANAGAGNYTKYGKEMHQIQPSNMDYPAAWCDAFVDWCFYKAFGADPARKILCGTFDDYTVNSAGYYKQAGRWSTTPKRGHQIFFRNSSGICHTGLVYSVDGGKVYTIEGNKGNAVCRSSYSINDASIAGYGMPRYDLATGSAETKHHYTGECKADACQLIRGDYGDAVKALQALLNLRGYKGKDGKSLTVDGEFGTNTEAAVTACQKAAGMSGIAFGTVSSLTWSQLLK